MNLKNMSIGDFTKIAVFTALAAVLTMFPQVPTPIGGYVHFGDSIIYIASIILGPVPGAVVGAVGHALADILTGHAIFALPTFIIKGIMGFAIGRITYGKADFKHIAVAGVFALITVTFGYFIAEIPMYGVAAAAASFISSPVQWLMSIVATAVLLPVISKAFKHAVR